MTTVEFTPEDIDAIGKAITSLISSRHPREAGRLMRLRDRMHAQRETELAWRAAQHLTRRREHPFQVIDGGAA